MPKRGELPDLPPRFIEGIKAANRGGAGEPDLFAASPEGQSRSSEEELRERLTTVEKDLAGADDEELQMERASIKGALAPLETASAATSGEPEGLAPPPNEGEAAEIEMHVSQALEAIEAAAENMDKLPEVVREAFFQEYFDGSPLAIDSWGDSRFSLEDARAAEENGYLTAEPEQPVFTLRKEKRPVRRADEA